MSIEWNEAFAKRRLHSPLADQLQRELQSFGISHFYYTCFFEGPVTAGIATRKRNNDYSFEAISSRTMGRMRYLSSPQPEFIRLLAHYFYRYGDFDKWMDRKPSHQLVVVKDGEDRSKFRRIGAAFEGIGISSVAFLDSHSCCQGVVGSFALHSAYADAEFEARIMPHQEVIHAILERFHQRCYQQFQQQLNPWLNLGVVGTVSQQVLQLLAQGLSTEAVASQLFISKRGVDYHLEQMKVILNARNRSHLIAKACAIGVVDMGPLRLH